MSKIIEQMSKYIWYNTISINNLITWHINFLSNEFSIDNGYI